MNKVVLVGRLTRDPEVKYSQGEKSTAICRYTLAVDRRFKRENEQNADFVPCLVFGKSAEFAEKYFRQGLRISVSGRIQTGSYTNKDGVKVYTTEVVVEEQEFAQNKNEQDPNNSGQNSSGQSQNSYAGSPSGDDGFVNVPDGIDEELPFN